MSTTSIDPRADGAPPHEPTPATPAEPAPHHVPNRWWVLVVIGLAQLMVVLDATIVNIALPSAQRDLGFSNDGRQWVVTAYSLAFGSLLLLGGRLADLLGRKTTLLVGLVGFAGSSALAGAAGDFSVLVIGRALQGIFGAVLAPSALSLLTTTFTDPKERAKAFGVFGAIAGSGGALGMLLGGVLTEHLNWRWTLYVNLVIAAIALVGTLLFVRRPAAAQRPRLDLLGTLLISAGLFCVVFGFSNAETHSWGSWMCWVFLAGGAVVIVLFGLWQTRAKNPLLPLRVFADRNRSASFASVFISGAGMFGVFLFLTYYLQQVQGFTPVKTGLSFLPMIGLLMVVAQVSTTVLIPKIGPKPIVPLGMALSAGGLVLLTELDLGSSYAPHVLPSLLLLGAGLGLVMPPAMSLATLGVAPNDQGVASAAINTMQQVGGSIGTALFSTAASSAVTDYMKGRAPTKLNIAHASLHSYATAYWWATGFFAAGLLVTLFLYRRGRPHAAPREQPAQAAPQAAPPEDRTAPVAAPSSPAPATPAPDASAATAPPGPDPAGMSGPGIRGRVVDEAGSPVPGAAVTLIDPSGRQLALATAGHDGRYGVQAPDAGSYILVGSATGRQPRVITLTVQTVPLDHDVVLAGGSGLTGKVLAGAGPVAQALVVVTDTHGEVAQAVTSADDGAYRLTELVPGSYTLTASATGFQPFTSAVEVGAGAFTQQDAHLRSAAVLRGIVRGPDGAPLADARVTLLDTAGNAIALRTTGSDGVYAFTDLMEAQYTLVASGYPPTVTHLTVTGGSRDGFDLELEHTD
ncbi:DHA2 family efflux MFS transporter permease subunit [Streptomyces tubbatahanensis]|uniref:alpha-amylase n=1 Tax=Streptomyces tubbatahanensis TaxID=2923272 RepID=A0ABY3XN71_9ACTN|nr:MFS transporter [Streptomyces tubbatahanensis]UNS95897.1 DHA2 family efflux MFS transporter permease subunit [Streptomyces tubbatahanensis]